MTTFGDVFGSLGMNLSLSVGSKASDVVCLFFSVSILVIYGFDRHYRVSNPLINLDNIETPRIEPEVADYEAISSMLGASPPTSHGWFNLKSRGLLTSKGIHIHIK